MPVVKINLSRFGRMVGANKKTILDTLPFIGLDIEGVTSDSVRVEYSPNRPDFGSDYGIARAMKGLLGKEVGLAKYQTSKSGVKVFADVRLANVRPFIACAVAKGVRLDDEGVRQVVSLQEDLHNGLGRRRRVVAIGLHDLDTVNAPLFYRAVESTFRFRPLRSMNELSIKEILDELPEGRVYGGALGHSGLYPVITDSSDMVLSFPPVINGDVTKITPRTKNVLVDVTSTDMRVGDDVLAVLATTLAEAGGRLGTVSIVNGRSIRSTPNLAPIALRLDLGLVRSTLGLRLDRKQVAHALARSRMELKGGKVLGPRYRIDLLHPVDLVEEVALGFGFNRIGPIYPPAKQPGSLNSSEEFLDSTATVMAESGMTEVMTFELVDEKSLYSNFARSSAAKISVHEPRSSEHSLLRDSLLPPLAAALATNAKNEYPQRVFEVGRVYLRERDGLSEKWHLGCLIAHSQSSFTEAKMYLESACRTLTGKEVSAESADHWAFAPGRCAEVHSSGKTLGYVGELTPQSLDASGIGVPVSGFEIDLAALHELLK